MCFLLSVDSGILATLRHALQDISSQVEYILLETRVRRPEVSSLIAPEILEVFSSHHHVEIMCRVKHAGKASVNLCSPLGDYCLVGKGCSDATFGMAAGISGLTLASFYRQCAVSTDLKRSDLPEPWLARLPVLEQFPSHSRAIQHYMSRPAE